MPGNAELRVQCQVMEVQLREALTWLEVLGSIACGFALDQGFKQAELEKEIADLKEERRIDWMCP